MNLECEKSYIVIQKVQIKIRNNSTIKIKKGSTIKI